jgi:hypothetical protein
MFDISFESQRTASLDEALNAPSISALVDRNRQKNSSEKVKGFSVGCRVVAHTNNGLILPSDLPMAGTKGTVVTVRTANGDTTYLDEGVFIQWDGQGDKVRHVRPEFIRVASMKVSSLEDFIVLSGPSLLSDSRFNGNSTGELVHKSTKDLWEVKVSAEGGYEIERLFDTDGSPLQI